MNRESKEERVHALNNELYIFMCVCICWCIHINRESEGARVAALTREREDALNNEPNKFRQKAPNEPYKILQEPVRSRNICKCVRVLYSSRTPPPPTHPHNAQSPNPFPHPVTAHIKKNHVTHPHPLSLFSLIYTHTPEVQGGPRASRDIPCRPSSTDLHTASTCHTQYICVYMYI